MERGLPFFSPLSLTSRSRPFAWGCADPDDSLTPPDRPPDLLLFRPWPVHGPPVRAARDCLGPFQLTDRPRSGCSSDLITPATQDHRDAGGTIAGGKRVV